MYASLPDPQIMWFDLLMLAALAFTAGSSIGNARID